MQIEHRTQLFQETHSFRHCLFNVVFLVPENLNSTTLQINQISVKSVVVAYNNFVAFVSTFANPTYEGVLISP
jgi:hypothetical protein